MKPHRYILYIYRHIAAALLLLACSTDILAQNNGENISRTDTLEEVVVTSREGKRTTSTSIISRSAIEHLQPSTFADLLALLPGGSTALPNLTNANTIHLRQAGIGGSDYDISSLGTVFVTDGIPMSQNANMQFVKQASSGIYGDPDAGRNHVNSGVDMRQIPTDNIESVEIIRGIAPVEYGDLTSGVVLIQRKIKATPYEARFKADSYSKLLYVGKGFEWKKLTAVVGIDWLDAKADPRNSLNNYKRLTVSARLQSRWKIGNFMLRWRSNTDYTGSFDNDKHDAEILKQKDDSYHSEYNRISMSHSFLLTPRTTSVLKSINLDIAANYERNTIVQQKSISISRDIAVSTVLGDGEHDGLYLPYHYNASVEVDGRPLNIYSKIKSLLETDLLKTHHLINIGAEWKMEKNYGHGQVYDPTLPLMPGTPYRPRNYREIPAQQQLSIYMQDDADMNIGKHQLRMSLGLRASTLLNLNGKYKMSGHYYLDPRANLQWRLPAIVVGQKQLSIDINGGWGRQTKFPTLMQIYPDKIYNDIIELNYFNINPDLRRLHMRTYMLDATNYGLSPAHNDKWEIRLGAYCDGNQFSVTYFKERMTTGFRTSSVARPFSYRDYNEAAIAGSMLTAPPELTDIPYEDKTILGLYSRTTNGSKLIKEGIEWQLSTKRYNAIKTRFTVNGAWFRTTYSNSEPMFRTNTSAVVEGKPVNQLYIGYYDNSSGTIREQLNTNVMADTYIKRLGLTFSLTAEMTWFYSTKNIAENGMPTAYMATDGNIYSYSEADRSDTYLQWLVNTYSSTQFVKQKTPFWAFVNLKVTKDFGSFMKLALFIDRMIDFMPDYKTVSGLTVRRTSKPYFGMEINFKL